MKYMVMECHPGYAVVLDEDGTFTKVANMGYQVGQTIADVVPLQITAPKTRKRNMGWMYSLAALAACLLLVLLPTFTTTQGPYASVYMTINPEVRIDVDRNDMVEWLEGVNADGATLIDGYNYEEKNLDLVIDELVDRAIEQGFLHAGGTVTLTLDAEDNQWVVSHGDTLKHHLDEHLADEMSVVVEVCGKDHHDDVDDDEDDHDDDDDCDDDMDDEVDDDHGDRDHDDDHDDEDDHHDSHHGEDDHRDDEDDGPDEDGDADDPDDSDPDTSSEDSDSADDPDDEDSEE